MSLYIRQPKTVAEVEHMFDKEPCRLCPSGEHFVNYPPGSVPCSTCDPLPDGRPRRHYHKRKHPRRRLRHIISGTWT